LWNLPPVAFDGSIRLLKLQGMMVPICRAALGVLLAGLWSASAQAAADDTVPCRSHDFGYTECAAPGLTRPQLVYQMSSSACIVNRTWGFDRGRKLLWVDNGCAGRFADVDGYHHGRTGQFDAGARRYDIHGEDLGPFVGGKALGAFFEGAESSAGAATGTTPPALPSAKAAASGKAGAQERTPEAGNQATPDSSHAPEAPGEPAPRAAPEGAPGGTEAK
jgi:hypothetical protein